jgi:hypothetical protein
MFRCSWYSWRSRARSAVSFFSGVPPRLEGAGAEHEREQMRGHLLPDRIRFREGRRGIAGGELQQPDVEVVVEAHAGEHLVRPDGHRHEEPYAVGLPLRFQDHHAIEQPLGLLLGGHPAEIDGRCSSRERRAAHRGGGGSTALAQQHYREQGAEGEAGDAPWQASTPPRGRNGWGRAGPALVTEAGIGRELGTTGRTVHGRGI